MEEKSVFKDLLDKYVKDCLTEDERAQFFEMLRSGTHRHELEHTLDEAFLHIPEGEDDVLREKIFKRVKPVPSLYRNRQRWWAAAAAIALMAGATYYFYNKTTKHAMVAAVPVQQHEIAPGGNKAVLTLSNGQKIVLDKATDGALAKQGRGTTIKKINGQVVYNNMDNETGEILYNTITTPVGGQFEVVLPDGSSVWLNSCSSLKYPIAFNGDKRNVTLTGEGYFDIKPMPGQPFSVNVDKLDVMVLGTRFNLMAYNDEDAIRTTLIQGAVRLDHENAHVLLKPGQEGRLPRNGKDLAVQTADVDDAIAWKNGLFSFENTDLKTIIRQMGRWYDLEIRFDGELPKTHFTGTISRNGPLSSVLSVLEAMDVHFKLTGRKLVVMPENK